MTIGSLFSGIGGLELGLEAAGLGPTIWQCEINPDARRILAKYWPNVPRWGDVRTFVPETRARVVCGGAPCQDLSTANLTRVGLSGDRSFLVAHTLRIVALTRPDWAVFENVSTWRDWVPHVRFALHGIGYTSVSLSLRACDFGAPFRGTRIFVVATPYSNGKSVATLYAKAQELYKVAKSSWRDWGLPPTSAMGMADGFSDRLDRVGNAVMPHMSAIVGAFIKSCEA